MNEGKIWIGLNVREPKVGERYFIMDIDDKYHRRGFVTEPVVEILNENKFKTKHFLYLYEKIENDD